MDTQGTRNDGPRAADRRTSEAFARFAPRLRAWLRRRLPAGLGVEDALQDVFLELTLANRAASEVEDMAAWLYHVARRRIVDALRRRPLQPVAAGAPFPVEAAAAASLEPDARYRQAEFARQFAAALRELPPEQRTVFVAHEFDGLAMADIARREGIGLNTALARKHYAVRRLRARLADFDTGYFEED